MVKYGKVHSIYVTLSESYITSFLALYYSIGLNDILFLILEDPCKYELGCQLLIPFLTIYLAEGHGACLCGNTGRGFYIHVWYISEVSEGSARTNYYVILPGYLIQLPIMVALAYTTISDFADRISPRHIVSFSQSGFEFVQCFRLSPVSLQSGTVDPEKVVLDEIIFPAGVQISQQLLSSETYLLKSLFQTLLARLFQLVSKCFPIFSMTLSFRWARSHRVYAEWSKLGLWKHRRILKNFCKSRKIS